MLKDNRQKDPKSMILFSLYIEQKEMVKRRLCTWDIEQNENLVLFRPSFHMIRQSVSSVTQSCPTLCDPMDCTTPGLPAHHQLPELAQTNVYRVSDASQPPHLLSSPSPPAFNLSQHQGLFQRVSSSHQVAKVLEFQL